MVNLSKGHVWEPHALRQLLVYFGVHTPSVGGDMYLICHVTSKFYSIEMTCIFRAKLLEAGHHLGNFGSHRYSDS